MNPQRPIKVELISTVNDYDLTKISYPSQFTLFGLRKPTGGGHFIPVKTFPTEDAARQYANNPSDRR